MTLKPQKINSPSAHRVFTIEAPLKAGQTLQIRYVPDREMVEVQHFQSWLTKKVDENTLTIEELTTQIGCHFYDAILPKYMDLQVQHNLENGLIGKAYFVHHQPEYRLPEILRSVFVN